MCLSSIGEQKMEGGADSTMDVDRPSEMDQPRNRMLSEFLGQSDGVACKEV